jgi:hypothetical protein
VLAKIRLALFEKRVNAFARLIGLVIQTQRLKSQAADAADVFRAGIERAFRDRDGGRALVEYFSAPPGDFLIKPCVRYHGVAQTHLRWTCPSPHR